MNAEMEISKKPVENNRGKACHRPDDKKFANFDVKFFFIAAIFSLLLFVRHTISLDAICNLFVTSKNETTNSRI